VDKFEKIDLMFKKLGSKLISINNNRRDRYYTLTYEEPNSFHREEKTMKVPGRLFIGIQCGLEDYIGDKIESADKRSDKVEDAVLTVEKKIFNTDLLVKGNLVTVYRTNGEVNDCLLLKVTEENLKAAIAVDKSSEPYILFLKASEVDRVAVHV